MFNDNNSAGEFEVSSDSLAFACASKVTMMKLNEVIQLLGKFLKWQRAAIDLLVVVLIRIEESDVWVDFPHVQVGAALFPALSEEKARRRVMACVKSLRMCQEESGFLAVDVRSGMKKVDEFVPTAYRANQFWPVIARIQERVAQTDALAAEDPKRRASDFRKIVREVVREFGFQPREASASRKRSPAPAKEDERRTWGRSEREAHILDFLEREASYLFGDYETLEDVQRFEETVEKFLHREAVKVSDRLGARGGSITRAQFEGRVSVVAWRLYQQYVRANGLSIREGDQAVQFALAEWSAVRSDNQKRSAGGSASSGSGA